MHTSSVCLRTLARRGLSSAKLSPLPTPSHWVIYNALELREEVERVQLSSFLARLRDRVKKNRPSHQAAVSISDTDQTTAAAVSSQLQSRSPGAANSAFRSAVGDWVQLEFSASKGSLTMAPEPIADASTVDAAWAYDMIRFFEAGGLLPPLELVKLLDLTSASIEADPTLAVLQDPGPGGRWAVVGDLHGSLSDLSACLQALGRIGPLNRIVFNGDFVDRGPHSVEVLAVVCALKLALPAYVHLNRGNHEDEQLSVAYDFAAELGRKYGVESLPGLMRTAGDLFALLPLAATFQGTLILHGGLPRAAAPSPTAISNGHGGARPDITKFEPWGLEDLAAVPRSRSLRRSVAFARDAALRDPSRASQLTPTDVMNPTIAASSADGTADAPTSGPSGPISIHSSKECASRELVVQDVLWSDPGLDDDKGVEVPHRDRGGAGCVFGGALAASFLHRHGLTRLVRSHQMVPSGARCVKLQAPRGVEGNRSTADTGFELWTVFSASRYPNGRGENCGAALLLPSRGGNMGDQPVALSWDSKDDGEDVEGGSGGSGDAQSRAQGLETKIVDNVVAVVWRHAHSLLEAWESAEKAESKKEPIGQVSEAAWARVLASVAGMRPAVWRALLPLLGGMVARKPTSAAAGHGTQRALTQAQVEAQSHRRAQVEAHAQLPKVNYRQQVRLVEAAYAKAGRATTAAGGDAAAGAIAALYQDPDNVAAMFAHLDDDDDGKISYEEFDRLVASLNADRTCTAKLSSVEGPAVDGSFGGPVELSAATNQVVNVSLVEHPLLDGRALWAALDRDRSGSISLNEFAEGARIAALDARGSSRDSGDDDESGEGGDSSGGEAKLRGKLAK